MTLLRIIVHLRQTGVRFRQDIAYIRKLLCAYKVTDLFSFAIFICMNFLYRKIEGITGGDKQVFAVDEKYYLARVDNDVLVVRMAVRAVKSAGSILPRKIEKPSEESFSRSSSIDLQSGYLPWTTEARQFILAF